MQTFITILIVADISPQMGNGVSCSKQEIEISSLDTLIFDVDDTLYPVTSKKTYVAEADSTNIHHITWHYFTFIGDNVHVYCNCKCDIHIHTQIHIALGNLRIY